MIDALESVARELWEKSGNVWNKAELAKKNSVDNAYRAKCSCNRKSLEYVDSLSGSHDEESDVPALLSYRDDRILIVVKSAKTGRRSLYCSVISSDYDASVKRIKGAGDLGKLLLQQNRVGNPDIVGYGSWELPLDNFAGLADFLYNLAHNS